MAIRFVRSALRISLHEYEIVEEENTLEDAPAAASRELRNTGEWIFYRN